MKIDILSNLIITRVRSVSILYTPEKNKGRRTDRSCWAAVIKYEGETVYTSRGKEFLSDMNHILLFPKGSSYDWSCTKSGHFCIIEFESESTFSDPITFTVKNGEKIFKLFKELEYKRNLKKQMMEIESIKDMYSILLEIIKSGTPRYLPSEKQQKIAPVIEYIAEHYTDNVTNDTLASVAGMSTVYFRKIFTSVIGVSPVVYTRNIRIEKAKEMIRSDYGTLSDLAKSLGYSNLYDFSRDFKKHTGVAPSKF